MNPNQPNPFQPQTKPNPVTPTDPLTDNVATAKAFGADYLDQIAPPPPAKHVSRIAIICLIVGVLLAVVFAIMMISSSQGPDFNSVAKKVTVRIDTLQSVTKEQQKHLTSNAIAEDNATLNSTLTAMSSDLAVLTATKKKTKDKKLAAEEEAYRADLSKTLTDAYQRGTIDRVYTVHMTFELKTLKTMLVKLNKSSKKKEAKDFCQKSIDNIDAVLKLYAEFDSSKS